MPPKLQKKIFGVVQIIIDYSNLEEKVIRKRGRNGERGKHGKGENEKMERGKEESKEKKKGRGKNVS